MSFGSDCFPGACAIVVVAIVCDLPQCAPLPRTTFACPLIWCMTPTAVASSLCHPVCVGLLSVSHLL
jgi:hypothetical protein